MGDVMAWRLTSLTNLLGADHLLPPAANLTISNVPGISKDFYFHGAKLEAVYPLSVLVGTMGLNITLLSCGDTLAVGLLACPDTIPALDTLAAYLGDAFTEFQKLFPSQYKPDCSGEKANAGIVVGTHLTGDRSKLSGRARHNRRSQMLGQAVPVVLKSRSNSLWLMLRWRLPCPLLAGGATEQIHKILILSDDYTLSRKDIALMSHLLYDSPQIDRRMHGLMARICGHCTNAAGVALHQSLRRIQLARI